MNNIIINTIDLLRTNKFYGVADEIEIVKGKYEMNTSFKIALNKFNRKVRKYDNRKKD